MKKAVLLAAIFVGAILGRSFAAQAQKAAVKSVPFKTTVVNDLLQAESVSAFFESVDPTGCIVIDVTLTGSIDRERKTGQPDLVLPETDIEVSAFDLCNVVALLEGSGGSNSQVFQVSDDLQTATLSAVIPLVDQNGFNFTATVNLKFKATSPIQSNHSSNVDHTTPGVTVINNVFGVGRDAVATGTISITGDPSFPDTPNSEPQPSSVASISKVISDTTTITTSH